MPDRHHGTSRRPGRFKTTRRTQRGIGLIEVLVAIVVLSVGMFGIVLSQLNSLRAQRSAHLRATAVQLASDMAERMRLNTAAIATSTSSYADPATTTYVSLVPAAGGTAPSAPALPTSFDAASQADYDLSAWRYEIARRLGPTTATGVVRETPGQSLGRTVVVMWREMQPTSALKATTSDTRSGSCPATASADALVCDPGCPADDTVEGAPMNLRCLQVGVQP